MAMCSFIDSNRPSVFSVIFAILLVKASSVTVSCPTLTCDETIGEDVCYIHSSDNPVTFIRTYECKGNEWCPLEDSRYAWIELVKQQYTSGAAVTNSQILNKYTKAKCEKITRFSQNLNNGRECSSAG